MHLRMGSEKCLMRLGYTDEREKADQLNTKERKPRCHECIGLHMGHVDQ